MIARLWKRGQFDAANWETITMGDAADDVFDAAEKEYAEKIMANQDDFVICEVDHIHHTNDAVLIAYYGEEYWIPRSLLSWGCDKLVTDLKRNDTFDIRLREWEANEIGLEYRR